MRSKMNMNSNEKEVCVSIFANKDYLEFDDYFYSKHSLTTVRQYLSKVGVWEKDIDRWFPDTDWDVNEDAIPETYLEYSADVQVKYFPVMSNGKWGMTTYPIDEQIDRWLENKKEVGKRELKSNHHKIVNKNAKGSDIFIECWVGNP